jgi:lipopolysaccharide/colanic/teichoic acid biosynthesis glycosyltransferase
MNGSMASTHGGTAVVGLRPAQAIAVRRIPPGKRVLDVLLAGAGLIAAAPLSCLVAAAVKLEDGGPIFYGQERVGEGGRLFRALKFRSMIANAEAGVGPVQAVENDTRVTRVGRVLRATAMDELPQLLNILRGDMSFVGPRALRPGEVETGSGGRHEYMEAIPGYVERTSVRPGRPASSQVQVRSRVRSAPELRSRRPLDPALVLDHVSRQLGAARQKNLILLGRTHSADPPLRS